MRQNNTNTKSDSAYKSMAKSIIFGILTGSIVCAAFLILFAFIFVKIKSVPANMVGVLATICAVFGSFACGYVSAVIRKEKGLFLGAVSGMAFFVVIAVIGFIVSRDKFTYVTAVKLLSMTLAGAVGGILAVNRKQR